MIRAKILGLGSYIPEWIVTNAELPYLNERHERCDEIQTDVTPEWTEKATGIRERRYVPWDVQMACSDLALRASQAALADAGEEPTAIDCIILATLSPDIHFPGTAVFLQEKLGISDRGCACYDLRQQCSGFLYGLQMADAFIRVGMYRRVLLVGSESVVLGPVRSDDPRTGVIYTDVHADGSGAEHLYLRLVDIAHRPMMWYDANDRSVNEVKYPQMNTRQIYISAVKHMLRSTRDALASTGMTWDDIDWFVPHQANLRINQKVVEKGKIPAEKSLNSIVWYGNTTAASIPLTLDHWRKAGRVQRGHRVLATAFGSGYTWGAAIFQL
jgi:3-oxoacyl-[acyl-carrier-protein] synthase-3